MTHLRRHTHHMSYTTQRTIVVFRAAGVIDSLLEAVALGVLGDENSGQGDQ